MNGLDKALIAAFELKWKEEVSSVLPPSNLFFEYVAENILNAFCDNADDECWEWQHSLVDKYAAAILAEHPEFANDEDSLLYREEE